MWVFPNFSRIKSSVSLFVYRPVKKLHSAPLRLSSTSYSWSLSAKSLMPNHLHLCMYQQTKTKMTPKIQMNSYNWVCPCSLSSSSICFYSFRDCLSLCKWACAALPPAGTPQGQKHAVTQLPGFPKLKTWLQCILVQFGSRDENIYAPPIPPLRSKRAAGRHWQHYPLKTDWAR